MIFQALPGCGHYKRRTLESWFQKRRKRERAVLKPSSSLPSAYAFHPCTFEMEMTYIDHSLGYPSIKQSKLETLRTLFASTSYPTGKVISVWANLLGAQLEDIEAWVSEAQEALERSCQSIPAPNDAPESARLLPAIPISTLSRSPSPVAKRRKLSSMSPATLQELLPTTGSGAGIFSPVSHAGTLEPPNSSISAFEVLESVPTILRTPTSYHSTHEEITVSFCVNTMLPYSSKDAGEYFQ